MNIEETAKLMTIAAAYDGRIVVDTLSITAWHEILAPYDYEPAKDVVVAHQVGPNRHRVLSVGDVCEALDARTRRNRTQIEADVRSAKARGIIAKEHPEAQELTPMDAARLAEARLHDKPVDPDWWMNVDRGIARDTSLA